MSYIDSACQIRGKVVEMSYLAKTAHLASALSCVDILTVLYKTVLNNDPTNPLWKDRDRFILSKGHAAMALYATLWYNNLISSKDLMFYSKKGSLLEEHPNPKQKWVETATGSLGHGLAIGNGMALAAKLKKKKWNQRV